MIDTTITVLMVVEAVFLLLTLYFVLSYMKYLKIEDERLEKQSKFAAISCLAIAFAIPILSTIF
ncbi:hypothetical protein [Lysinibacillus sp. 54212]|uniref:hypothetical protein n=1 Tax=Lysinibacillus sp. 54212 TaxID=3119829 RepID=UPI002FC65F51